MRVAIVEDSPADASALLAALRDALPKGAPEPQTSVFASVTEFARAFTPGTYELLILDCALGGDVTGVDLARAVRSLDRGVSLVFVTSSTDYAIEGYEVGAAGYVLKPVNVDRLRSALERALPSPEPEQPVLLGEGTRLTPVLPNGIVWVRSVGHYLEVRLSRGETLKVRGSHGSAVNSLSPLPQFFVPIRGYIINFAYVSEFLETEFVMSDGTRAPVSRANRPAARDAYASFMFRMLREGLA